MEFNTKLGDILELNPATPLKKGTEAKKVAMADVKENQKFIESFEVEKFKGGAKFKNGDTLVARITPCLENGKTAFVDILEENEIAFGSTEFFVIRSIKNLTDPQYLYYLMRTPNIRNILIKSMTGTSGRQRAQKEALLNTEIVLPPLSVQQAIGRTLKNLDEKIKLNSKIIANLEELSQILFKRWFMDFEFPDKNGNPYKSSGGEFIKTEIGDIPKHWEIKKLEEIATHKKKSFNPQKEEDQIVAHFSLPAFDTNQMPVTEYSKDIKSNKWLINQDTVLFSKMNPRTMRVWLPNARKDLTNVASTEFVVLESKDDSVRSLIYNLLNTNIFKNFLLSNATGSTNSRQRVKPHIAVSFQLALNEKIVKLYGQRVNPLMNKIISLRDENAHLNEMRDILLPKLMSGELELPEALEV